VLCGSALAAAGLATVSCTRVFMLAPVLAADRPLAIRGTA
jgi:hypothetical protein